MSDSIMSLTHFLGDVFSIMECRQREAENPKPIQPPDYTPTEKAIAEMLQENTGCHICDSGGAYGRAWQRNRHVQDFRQTPRLVVEIDKHGHIYPSLNVFHFLVDNLDLDERCKRLQTWFYQFNEKNKDEDWGWPQIVDEFFEQKLKKRGWEKAYGENTYNRESMLSQVLQYEVFELDGDEYVFLQIHGGADVRGGYTSPRVFRVMDEFALISDNNIFAKCDCVNADAQECGNYWTYEMQSFDWMKLRQTTIYKSGEFPPTWKVRENKNGENEYYCKRCKKAVMFSA